MYDSFSNIAQWFPVIYYYLNDENCHDNDNYIDTYHNNLFILIIAQLHYLFYSSPRGSGYFQKVTFYTHTLGFKCQ